MVKKEGLSLESTLNPELCPKNPFLDGSQSIFNPSSNLLMNPLVNQALLLQAITSQKLSQAAKPFGNLGLNPLASLFGGDLLIRSLTLNLELLSSIKMNSEAKEIAQ